MRFLSLATYPKSSPRHGGQLRLNAIHQTLNRAGWETRQFAICPRGGYSDSLDEEGVLEMSESYASLLHREGRRSDVASSDYLLHNQHAEMLFDNILTNFNPDVVCLEQPWLWPALRRHFDRFKNRHRFIVVYSSQNVEERLLRDEYEIAGGVGASDELATAVEIERTLAEEADGIVAVSELDAQVFRELNDNVVIAPNGVWSPEAPGGLDYWQNVFSGNRHALFVGSYHAPNGEGFRKCMLKPSLAFLAPDEKIVVAGRVSALISSLRDFRKHAGVNLARTMLVGPQDNGGLSALYHLSKVIVLPITEGGGTNIKTAEALVSGKRIVATRKAMRGYDDYLHLPGVTVVDDIKSFPSALKMALDDESDVVRSQDEQELLRDLLWDRSLRPFDPFLRSLMRVRPLNSIVLNQEIRGEQLASVIGRGWFNPETGGVWSAASSADIAISVASAGRYRVHLLFSGFPPINHPQYAIISRDSDVASCLVIKDIPTVHQSELLIDLDEDRFSANQTVNFKMISSSLTSPSEVLGGEDYRKLGICLVSIKIEMIESDESSGSPSSVDVAIESER